jgi:hypothetical protein
MAWKVTPARASRTVVSPMTSPERSPKPWLTTRRSSTSSQPWRMLANRNRPRSCRESTSSTPDSRSGSGSSQCDSPRLNPSLSGPHTESDGIHDIDVVVALTRIRETPWAGSTGGAMTPRTDLAYRPNSHLRAVRRRGAVRSTYRMRHGPGRFDLAVLGRRDPRR